MSDWENCREKIASMLVGHNRTVLEHAERLYNSGGVDVEAYDPTHYSLSKVLLTAALEDSKNIYEPPYQPWKDDVANLKHF